ncbi:MAG TPA: L,D-transpeptidase [Chthoniobacteraceae bacterium]|nr:L,D-transpeptidase [Chthoniobacteraceae bacterium]
MIRKILLALLLSCVPLLPARAYDFGPSVVISVGDQKLAVIDNGKVKAKYEISTSKYGLGDTNGSYKTPVGALWVCNKIGDHLAPGTVIKNRVATREVVAPNAPGRDPIVSRVIWLQGMNEANRNAYDRGIYIHGTPEERLLGHEASYGCIRMRSKDVIALYDQVHIGTRVTISSQPLSTMLPARPHSRFWLFSLFKG